MSEAEVWVASPPPKGASFILLLVCSFLVMFFGTLFLLRILLSLYRLLGRLIWGRRVANSVPSGLSTEKKTEIDDLREVAIRRYLKDYTMQFQTYECNDTSGSVAIEQSTKLAAQQESKNEMDTDHSEEPKEETKIDIDEELVNKRSRDQCTEKCTLLESSTSTSESDSSLAKDESLQQSSNHSYEKLECIIMNDNDNDDNKLHCTICHEVYEPSERICHASNSDCIHIFHEDCIVHWLVSLGWMKLKEKHLNERMMKDIKELMNYELECPCCRQDFIDQSLFDNLDQEEKAEESLNDEMVVILNVTSLYGGSQLNLLRGDA